MNHYPTDLTDNQCQVIEKFLNLTIEQRKEMGKNARAKIEKNFDRNIVVNKYLEELENDK